MMMSCKGPLCSALLALTTAWCSKPAAAPTQGNADKLLSAAYSDCMDKSEGITVNIRDCQGTEYQAQDARLNSAYRAVMAGLPPDRQAALRDEERSWVKTKKQTCDHAGDDDAGGTLQDVSISDCYMRETAKRANYIQAYTSQINPQSTHDVADPGAPQTPNVATNPKQSTRGGLPPVFDLIAPTRNWIPGSPEERQGMNWPAGSPQRAKMAAEYAKEQAANKP
jgi:uncharacterized protein YecT (DUF1311 family)